MITNFLALLAVGLFQVLFLLLFLLIPLILIPNRKFKEILENEIDEKIKSLNLKERVSFNYKGAKISLKRIDNKLKIEPYTNRFIELLLRVLGFFLAMFLVGLVLAFMTQFLDSMGVGDRSFSDGTARSVSWQGIVQISARELWFMYFIIFYYFGKIIRKKVFNRLLVIKYKKDWDEFCSKYDSFKY